MCHRRRKSGHMVIELDLRRPLALIRPYILAEGRSDNRSAVSQEQLEDVFSIHSCEHSTLLNICSWDRETSTCVCMELHLVNGLP